MSYLQDWSGLGDGPNVPQGLNPCDTWQARVSGGSAGSMPVMPPGFYLITATDLGGGHMILSGTYQGPPINAPNAFVDAGGGPNWAASSFTPSADPSLTWNTTWSQCMPTLGFNPGGGGGGVTPQPVQPTPAPTGGAPIRAPVGTAPVGAAPASTSSSTGTVAWVAGGLTVAGVLAWALLK